MAIHRNPRLAVLSPAQFRRRIRPYLPGTILELKRLWPGARKRGYEHGQQFVIGPYCSGCGTRLIYLFRIDGSLDCTADRRWLRDTFDIVGESRSRALYTFPKPWPPRMPYRGAAA